MIDHRELLKKYMAVVLEEEGVTFIPAISPAYPLDEAASKLTREEIAELTTIAREIQ